MVGRIIQAIHIPISQSLSSKFQRLKLESSGGDSEKQHELNMMEINKKVLNFNRLGSNNDLVVDYVKSSGNFENLKELNDETAGTQPADHHDDTKPDPHSTEIVPLVTSTSKSCRKFVKDFFNFQALKLKASNPQLATAIKNYDTALSSSNLKSYTAKVVEETKHDPDFDDYTFTRYNHVQPETPKKLDIAEFMDYLTTYEGFTTVQLEFLKKNIDFGLDEIEKELNKIKDIEREEKQIAIDGEKNAGARLSIHYLWVLLTLFII